MDNNTIQKWACLLIKYETFDWYNTESISIINSVFSYLKCFFEWNIKMIDFHFEEPKMKDKCAPSLNDRNDPNSSI